MESSQNKKLPLVSSKVGLVTGAILLAIGLWIFFKKPETNKMLPYFMIIYGAFRLGHSAYMLNKHKKNETKD